ncbi:MAG TPA: VOC family protein [Acidimicrobiia bacterium]|jgi:predicted enzyme related to lactoylglutathione lyase|nr:VOC family protein [Acidimicrobiia bacterium]
MQLEGITWHALTLQPDALEATKKLLTETFGVPVAMEMGGAVVFSLQNGTLLELYTPESAPAFGYNGNVAFGFRVDDIEAASAAVAAAGCELLGDINRVPDMKYAYRHFKGPDGIVYGLNEQR